MHLPYPLPLYLIVRVQRLSRLIASHAAELGRTTSQASQEPAMCVTAQVADEAVYITGKGNFKGVIYRGHKTGDYYYMNDDDTWSEGFDTYKECGKAYSALR